MRWYVIALVLLITPCLALGLWSWGRYAHRRAEEGSALAASWQALARARAQALLRDGVGAGSPPPAAGAPATRWQAWVRDHCAASTEHVLLLDAQGVRSLLAAVLPSTSTTLGPTPPDPELALAQSLEFAHEDLPRALAAYRHLCARSELVRPLRAEAKVGIIACLHRLDRDREAVAALEEALRHAELRPGAAGALTLEVIPHAATAAGLLALEAWRQVVQDETEGTIARALAQTIRDHAADLGAEREAALAQVFLADADAANAALWTALSDDERLSLRNPGVQVLRLLDGQIALTRPLSQTVTLLNVQRPEHLAQTLAQAIPLDPQLALLARSYARQCGASITTGRAAIPVDLPDGSRLAVPLLAPETPGTSWLGRHLPELGIALTTGLILMSGLVLIVRTAARDRRLARLHAEFVSTVSHELKTPLSLIHLYAEMLELGYATRPEDAQRARGVILGETERLQALVEQVLAADTIERGSMSLRLRRCDLGALVRSTLDAYRPRLDREGFEVEAACAPGGPYVEADSDAITRIVINLITNAVTYSDHQRWLSVRARAAGDAAVIEVEDKGIGIAREDQARIFERFVRLDGSLVRERRGLGLGLCVVRSLVRAHGGDISVASQPGVGSTFTVRLPLGQVEESPA